MSVDVRMNGDDVQISVRTETDAARRMLQQRATQLREALGQHGIHVNHFEVTGDLAGRDVQGDPTGEEFFPGGDRGETPQRRMTNDSPSLGAPEAPDAIDPNEENELVTVGERRIDVRV